MKKKLVVALISAAMVTSMLGACGSNNASSSSASSTATSSVSASSASEEDTTAASSSVSASSASEEVSADADQEAADKVADLIDAIYVQERNDNTDEQCKEAKEAWDALTDAQKELVEGENADPDYFGRDTGDASKDDPLNGDEIGENELLVVSFGTSFNDSRAEDIGGVEKALQAAYPDWSVRRAFTAQIIINHVQARDDEKIDNVDQALERAVSNGVKKLIIQPTHLMHGAEYDELKEAVDSYKDKFESVTIAEPLLGEVGSDATVINEDKQAVAEAITAQAVKSANYDSLDAAAEDGTAFVFMGHGTSHTAKVTYSQMQTQMDTLGYKNVFIGTVEGEPEETACENVIEAVKAAGYKKVILRPLMVVAGDHANNDMAGEDEDSWKSQFEASGAFDEIDTQIEGLGRIDAVEVKESTAYTSTADLAGKTVVAEAGSAGEAAIQGDENLAKADYVSKSVQTDCLMEVAAGTADAAVLDLTLANAMIGEGTDYASLKIVDELNAEEYGVAFRKGSDAAAAVDAAFDELKADGTMQALAEKYELALAD